MGVIPSHLTGAEQGKHDLATLVVTLSKHEHEEMFMHADANVVLGGGAGSPDEFFKVPTCDAACNPSE